MRLKLMRKRQFLMIKIVVYIFGVHTNLLSYRLLVVWFLTQLFCLLFCSVVGWICWGMIKDTAICFTSSLRKLSQKLQQEATWGWGLGEFENSWNLKTIDELPPLELWISDNIKASNTEEITQLCESCTWLKIIKKRMFPIGWQNYRDTWSGCKSSAASCARQKQQKASDERRQRHARLTKQQPLGISRKNTEKRWKTSTEMNTESRKNMRKTFEEKE